MSLRIYSRAIIKQIEKLFFPYRLYMLQHHCIFIHIPKVAGTSVLNVLSGYAVSRDHLPWHVYYVASPKRFWSYFKFSLVRNPWERAWSTYQYLVNGGNKTSDLSISNELKQFSSFDDFLISGLGKGNFRSHLLFQPQSNFIVGPDGRPVVDYLGRYESLNDDFAVIAKRLNISTPLPHSNKGLGSLGVSAAYKKVEAIRVVAEIYKQDIKAFGYSFPET